MWVPKYPTEPPVVADDGVGILGMVACLPYVALGAGLVMLVVAVFR